MAPHIINVLAGKAVPYTRPGTTSGIHKSPLAGNITVGPLGVECDEQGDRRVHGGVDKAVHCYPSEHYPYWQERLGSPDVLARPGAFGENLHTVGLTEDTVCLGDHYRAGSVLFSVSQGRQPCWKLNDRFHCKTMARDVQSTGKTGWYFRVKQSGQLKAGDALVLEKRPYPDWPLSRILNGLYARDVSLTELQQLVQLPLPGSWLTLLQRKLGNWKNRHQEAENSHSARLDGPTQSL